MAPSLPRTFMDFSVGVEPKGRVVFELFADRVPKTAENFRLLCTGERGISPISHVPLHYKNSIIHRIIEDFMIQGGDFTKRNGSGGESIYGRLFEDEMLEGEGTEVDRAGLLVMANRGPNTNGSQWFVTLAPAPHLTGKHVVFGRVIHGFEHIEALEHLPTDDRDRPLTPVTIAHCGELVLGKAKQRRTPSPSPTPSAASDAPPRRRGRAGNDSESPIRARRRETGDGEHDASEDERDVRKPKDRRKRDKEGKSQKKRKPKEETVDELDARLEREEKEQLDKEKRDRLAHLKVQIGEDRQMSRETGEVVYKGRGAMRYLDPESAMAKRMPMNYDSRMPDIRPRAARRGGSGGGLPGSGAGGRDEDKWQRGMDVRPNFAAEGDKFRRGTDRVANQSKDDGELDRVRIKGRSRDGEDGDDVGREGRKRDWDDWRVGRAAQYGEGRKAKYELRNGRSESRSKSKGTGRDRSRSRSRSPLRKRLSPSPEPEMRPESPLRGDRSDASSDMVMDDD